MAKANSGGRTDKGDRPVTGPGALCWCGCREEIPERKPGGKRRTKKDTQYINANHRLRGKKPKRQHVVSYPGEHCSEVRSARCQAQSRRSLLETGASSVRELIEAWYRSNRPIAAVIQLPPQGVGSIPGNTSRTGHQVAA